MVVTRRKKSRTAKWTKQAIISSALTAVITIIFSGMGGSVFGGNNKGFESGTGHAPETAKLLKKESEGGKGLLQLEKEEEALSSHEVSKTDKWDYAIGLEPPLKYYKIDDGKGNGGKLTPIIFQKPITQHVAQLRSYSNDENALQGIAQLSMMFSDKGLDTSGLTSAKKGANTVIVATNYANCNTLGQHTSCFRTPTASLQFQP